MAQLFTLHPDNPQPRLIRRAVELIRAGAVIAYPTDSCYALGCRIGDKAAVDRIRCIRGIDAKHPLSLVCRDLREISIYARVDNVRYRMLKAATPGCYAFILEATREVPKRLQHPSRRTIGLRVPDHEVVRALLAELNEPLLSSSLILPGEDVPLNDVEDIRERLEHQVDLVIAAGACGVTPTTVVNLTGETPVIERMGKGDVRVFGVSP